MRLDKILGKISEKVYGFWFWVKYSPKIKSCGMIAIVLRISLKKFTEQLRLVDLKNTYTKNTPRVFHAETTWKRPFPRCFKMDYTWCVCRTSLKNCGMVFETTRIPFSILKLPLAYDISLTSP